MCVVSDIFHRQFPSKDYAFTENRFVQYGVKFGMLLDREQRCTISRPKIELSATGPLPRGLLRALFSIRLVSCVGCVMVSLVSKYTIFSLQMFGAVCHLSRANL